METGHKILQCIGLLSLMIMGKENHSSTSLDAIQEAKKELEALTAENEKIKKVVDKTRCALEEVQKIIFSGDGAYCHTTSDVIMDALKEQ